MSRKAKLNELKFYRLKAKKKMNSPNPEVRIRYKLEKAKRKETWLIEKLRKFDVPKPPPETYDPEILTEEERHYLKRTGERKKHYVLVGRRGVFGGVVLNMHLHWKNHETVKVICKPCKPGQVHEYAEELARLSKGIVIDIKPNNTIIFYRGKNYVKPEVMSPPNTLSKAKLRSIKDKASSSAQAINHIKRKYELENMEIVNKEKEKADKAIAEIEAKCGQKIEECKEEQRQQLMRIEDEHTLLKTMFMRNDHEAQIKALRCELEDECRKLEEELHLQKSKEDRQRALLQLQWKVMSDKPKEDQEVNSKQSIKGGGHPHPSNIGDLFSEGSLNPYAEDPYAFD
ncbi:hypothetical protein JHK87_006091 [Glycine soja]|nr:hypothetical protein JHK87_006091 [Glycine soja]